MRTGLSRAKRKLGAESLRFVKKKLRSELPRRRRSQISPILLSSCNLTLPSEKSGFPAFSVDSTANSYLGSEVSCGSSRAPLGSESTGRSNLRKREIRENKGCGAVRDASIRRVTRSYYRNKEIKGKGGEVEVSEASCVESNSGADAAIVLERTSNSNGESGKLREIVVDTEGNKGSEVVFISDISCVEQVSGGFLNFQAGNIGIPSGFKENDVFSDTSGVESCSVAKFSEEGPEQTENRALKLEFAEISGNPLDVKFTVSNSEWTTEQNQNSFDYGPDLSCTEQFSPEDVSDSSSSHETAFSDYQSDFFLENSDLEFLETHSSFFNSGSEFSERSVGDSPPSHSFVLLLQYREVFLRSTTALDSGIARRLENECHNQVSFVRFEDEDDEESYKALRGRERRQVFLRNYPEEYCSTTEYGDLVLQQRTLIVNWIIKQSTEKKLQQETMFLGVSLLDRFLSKGFFGDKRKLQIAGIACLTLATRFEENQPYNSVRQENFCIDCNVYSRCEVVAMEWLILEVLNFQCFLPTVYNFLWFYLKASKADAEMEKRAKYLAVLVLSSHEQLCYWPSTVAAVLVIFASLESGQDAFHQRVIESLQLLSSLLSSFRRTHIRTKDRDLNGCIESLEWLLRYK